ncbi:MAG: hypothetical protein QXV08_08230 [Desulfurococcus sp.]|uniref:hypothetical protein n=1 Tax=Desulfurococcus sp. TaxID=51678 RepID=UPI00317768F5
MNYMLESLLRSIDSVLGLANLPTALWLLYVMAFFLIFTIIAEFLKKPNPLPHKVNKKQLSFLLVLFSLGFNSFFSLLAFIVSYMNGYYYNFQVVLALIAQLILSLALSMLWNTSTHDKRTEFAKRFLVHLSAITIIFIVSARWIIRGVDAEETSSDTLNIYYNSYFRYSMHAGWYDLAPVDSIIKVILLRVGGNNDPFSPLESFLISFMSGLFLYILVYAYVKSKLSINHLLPLIPAILTIYPYAFLPGAYATPTNIAVALALASLILFLLSDQNRSKTSLITLNVLFITSLLAHPFSLSVLIFVAICLFAKYVNGLLGMHDFLFFLSASILWLIKTMYTATIYGIAGIWNNVINGIFQVSERESIIAFRNVGYFEMPKIPLASFSASLGIIGGIAIVISLLMLKDRPITPRWLGLSIILFTGFTGLSSLLAALGGQSRYIMVPFASLFSLVILFYGEIRNISPTLKALITIAAILTMLSPNFMPDQYPFYMSAKISDRTMFEISSSLFEKLDPTFVVDRFQGTSNMKLYIEQQSEFIRNMGESGLIVDKLILSGVIKARSYWDFVGRGPFDYIEGGQEYSTFSIIWDSGLVKVLAS